jgi:hypothetical protein
MAIYAMAGMNINSGVKYTINGTVYVPTGPLIPNVGTWNKAGCTILIAQSITFNSGATMNLSDSNCAESGYPVPSGGASSGSTGTSSAVKLVR